MYRCYFKVGLDVGIFFLASCYNFCEEEIHIAVLNKVANIGNLALLVMWDCIELLDGLRMFDVWGRLS